MIVCRVRLDRHKGNFLCRIVSYILSFCKHHTPFPLDVKRKISFNQNIPGVPFLPHQFRADSMLFSQPMDYAAEAIYPVNYQRFPAGYTAMIDKMLLDLFML